MAEDGRYYWLKLKRDFFKRHDIRIIESMPNGKDYILFYLKLLCESVDHDGSLRFSDQIPYNEEMLSTITDTNIDIVRSAIKVFAGLHMMDILDDGTYYMSEVSRMIGSAANNDNANRQRRFRESKKVTALQNVTVDVTKSNESKSKSKRIDKELSASNNNIPLEGVEDDADDDLIKPDPLCVYASSQLRISPTGIDELISFRDSLSDDLIKYAIDRAIDLGSRNYAYVRKILNGYVEAGFKTVGDAKAAEAKKSAKAKFDDGYDNSGIYW